MSFQRITEVMDALDHVKRQHAAKPSIKCGDVNRLWSEINRALARDGKDLKESTPVSSMQIGGVQVHEHPYLPPHIAVVMMGDEVVNIINFDAPAHPTLPKDAA